MTDRLCPVSSKIMAPLDEVSLVAWESTSHEAFAAISVGIEPSINSIMAFFDLWPSIREVEMVRSGVASRIAEEARWMGLPDGEEGK